MLFGNMGRMSSLPSVHDGSRKMPFGMRPVKKNLRHSDKGEPWKNYQTE